MPPDNTYIDDSEFSNVLTAGNLFLDDFPFPDVLNALTKPVLVEPGSRQLVMDYAILVHPQIADLDESLARDIPAAALILCEPMARLGTLAAMLKIPEATLSNYAHRRRDPNSEVRARARSVFRGLLFEEEWRLRMARFTLFACAWAPWVEWNADDTPAGLADRRVRRQWTAAFAQRPRLSPSHRRVARHDDSDSPFRKPHPNANHLVRVIKEAGVRGADPYGDCWEQAVGLGVACPH